MTSYLFAFFAKQVAFLCLVRVQLCIHFTFLRCSLVTTCKYVTIVSHRIYFCKKNHVRAQIFVASAFVGALMDAGIIRVPAWLTIADVAVTFRVPLFRDAMRG